MPDFIRRWVHQARALFPRRIAARSAPAVPPPPPASPYALWATAHGFDVVRRPVLHAEAGR
ncbi:hypothetical protein [Streptomyces syringium]|uniref:hypothetical protein n=1 Tax=Streptomyces syringium TaxID=76729 RepID=UPI003AAF12E7